MLPVNLTNISILKIKNADYCCIITRISKIGGINFMQNIDLTKEILHYKKLLKININSKFWSCKIITNSNLNK